MVGGGELSELSLARTAFIKEGARKLTTDLKGATSLHTLVETSNRFLHRVNTDLLRKSDLRSDIERVKFSDDTRTMMEERVLKDDAGDSTKQIWEAASKDILPKEQIALLREKILKYLQRDHPYFWHQLDSLDRSAYTDTRMSENADVREAVLTEVINYIGGLRGAPTIREPLEFPAIRSIAKAVVKKSTGRLATYANSKLLDIGDPVRVTRKEEDRVKAELSVVELDPKEAKFAQRDWRKDAVDRSSKGIKIFETPYYESIFSRCDTVRDKQNGIGGKVFYGPPGTGKTEIAIYDAQQRNGFNARVVSMHYWSSFHSLVYESSVKVAGGTDKALSYLERMQAGIGLFEGMDAKVFEGTLKQMHLDLARKGKISGSTTLAEFLRPFMGDDDLKLLEGAEPDWGKLKNAVVGGLKRHAAAATFGHVMTEEDFWSEVVKGELLQAIDAGQDRIILDEGEKAGPFAWAGLSRILAMSPGESIDIGNRKISIPSNMRFDVTVNSLDIGEFLRSRFNEIYVGYPPAKDEIMIASGWLSDKEGNILLSENEQYQLVGFFTYLLPKIRDLYKDQVLGQPFDLRVTHELCNLLVDGTTKRRTGMSLERAVEMILFEQRAFTQFAAESGKTLGADELEKQRTEKQGKAFKELRTILDNFRSIIESPVVVAGAEESVIEAEEARRQTVNIKELRASVLKQGYDAILSSPLSLAAVYLPDYTPTVRDPSEPKLTELKALRKIELSDKSRERIDRWLQAQDQAQHPSNTQESVVSTRTDIGFHLQIGPRETSLKLITDTQRGTPIQLMEVRGVPNYRFGDIEDVSADARFSLVKVYRKSEGEKRYDEKLMAIDIRDRKPVSAEESQVTTAKYVDIEKLADVGGFGKARILEDGTGVFYIDGRNKRLILSTLNFDGNSLAQKFHFPVENVTDFEMSLDGNVVLIKTPTDSWFVDVQQVLLRGEKQIQPTAKLEGDGWELVGNKIFYNQKTKQSFFVSTGSFSSTKEFIQ